MRALCVQFSDAHECNRLLRQLLPGLLTQTLSAVLRNNMMERNFRQVHLQCKGKIPWCTLAPAQQHECKIERNSG